MADPVKKVGFGMIETVRVDGRKTVKRTGATRSLLDAIEKYERNHVVEGCWVTAAAGATTGGALAVSTGVVIQNGRVIPVGGKASMMVGSNIGVLRAYIVVPSTAAAPGVLATPTFRMTASHQTNVPSLYPGDIVLAKFSRGWYNRDTGLATSFVGSVQHVATNTMIDNNARPTLYRPYGEFTV